MSDAHNDLDQLIESTRQDARAQQAKADEQANKPVTQVRGKHVMAAVLLAAFAAVLFYQYPRFSEPYAWPDAATNAGAAEGKLMAVVGLIDGFRIAQGRYPVDLSEVDLPEGMAAVIAESVLVYRTEQQSYTLDWTLPHWHARYDSQTESVSVEPIARK